jgi:hypothetical protein
LTTSIISDIIAAGDDVVWGCGIMNLQEVWEIKAEESKKIKDMTTAQLIEYHDNVLREFSIIMDN